MNIDITENAPQAIIALNSGSLTEVSLARKLFNNRFKLMIGSYKNEVESSYLTPIRNNWDYLVSVAIAYNQASILVLTKRLDEKGTRTAALYDIKTQSYKELGEFKCVGIVRPNVEAYTKDIDTGLYYTTLNIQAFLKNNGERKEDDVPTAVLNTLTGV